jgi:hypothetical protein
MRLYTLAIAAVAAASLSLPLANITQAASVNGGTATTATQPNGGTGAAGQSAAQKSNGNAAANQSAAHMQNTKKGKKTATTGRHHKKHARMSSSRTHRELYGSMRPPSPTQTRGIGAGTTGATGPNGPGAANPSGVK